MAADSENFGVVIAVEDYQKDRLQKVDFAVNDASKMKDIFHGEIIGAIP